MRPNPITAGSGDYKRVTNPVRASFVVAKVHPSQWNLDRKFSKGTDAPLSAVNLTWGRASALTAVDARVNALVECQDTEGLVGSDCSRY